MASGIMTKAALAFILLSCTIVGAHATPEPGNTPVTKAADSNTGMQTCAESPESCTADLSNLMQSRVRVGTQSRDDGVKATADMLLDDKRSAELRLPVPMPPDRSDDSLILEAKLQNHKSALAHPNIKHADIGALILEPRCHVALPLSVWNMRKQLPSLPIQLFYAESNEDCVKTWFANMNNMTLTKLGKKFWLGHHNHEDCSWIYTNPDFWAQVRHEKVLSFEQDSWVCNHAEAKLKTFEKYDYVGAPWPPGWPRRCPGGVGNGGFSLRNVNVMKDISTAFGQTTRNEDVYFCEKLGGWKSVNVPDSTEAAEFSAEEWDGSAKHSPLGIHQAYRFPWYTKDAELHRNCPGVHLLAHANKVHSRYEGNHTDAVKMGDHLVKLAEKLIPEGRDFAENFGRDGKSSLLETGSSSLFAVTIRMQSHASIASSAQENDKRME